MFAAQQVSQPGSRAVTSTGGAGSRGAAPVVSATMSSKVVGASEPLGANHPKYKKVSGDVLLTTLLAFAQRHPTRLRLPVYSCSRLTRTQIRDLNSGTFGFVELALDKTTGQQVAIKFIERGDKVHTPFLSHALAVLSKLLPPLPECRPPHEEAVVAERSTPGSTLFALCPGHQVCGEGNSESSVPHAPAYRAV